MRQVKYLKSSNKKTKKYEWIFYFFILIWAFLPSRFAPLLEIGYLKVSISDLSIIVLFLFLLPLIHVKNKSLHSKLVFVLFTGIIVYAFFTLLWNDSQIGIFNLIYPLVISWISMAVGYFFSKVINNEDELNRITTNLSFLLCFIFVIYSLESLLGLGLRSEEGSYITPELGVERLKGPLGGAAVIHITMLPVLSIFLAKIIYKHPPVILYWVATILIGITTILTGSRAALFSMIVVFILFLFVQRSFKLLLTTLLSILFIFVSIIPIISFDRFSNMEDIARFQSYSTSLKLSMESVSSFILGQGYGNIWTWYPHDIGLKTGVISKWDNLKLTHAGIVLYHPHSVFLELLTELGVFSVLAFLMIIIILVNKFIKNKHGLTNYIIIGIIATIPSFFLDLYLLKNWKISTIWWTFVFIALSNQRKRSMGSALCPPPGMKMTAQGAAFSRKSK